MRNEATTSVSGPQRCAAIIPKDAAKPTSVHLKLAYAVCANLCVPAEANLQLSLTGDGDEEMALDKAEIRVPRRVALGASNGLAILSVCREPGNPHERVVVVVAAPEGALVDLFVEGPTPDWSLPLPEPKLGRSNMVSRSIASMIERNPRAPVLRSMAFLAMAPSASSATVRPTPSISNNR